jgi:hypothetical protein
MPQQTNGPHEGAAILDMKIRRIQELSLPDLRSEWARTYRKKPPRALSRQLLVYMLAWKIQEDALGGHSREVLRILKSYSSGRQVALRYLQPGTDLIRENQGERHTVSVTTDGFRWRGKDFSSLTAIANAITGADWNGPRFFGLRQHAGSEAKDSAAQGRRSGAVSIAEREGMPS